LADSYHVIHTPQPWFCDEHALLVRLRVKSNARIQLQQRKPGA